MKEAGVKSAGKTSAIGIKKRRHKPARRSPGCVYFAQVLPSPVDAEREQAEI